MAGAIVLCSAGFVALVQLTPFDPTPLIRTSSPTVVYARDGSVFETISAPGSSDLTYEQIPTVLQNAIVATEDHNFWHSSSIDLRGLLRSAVVDLMTHSLSQGGSTIQMQLAKIVYLNSEKTFSRKLQQIALGVQINRHFTKQEILAMYLNRVYLGEGCVGVRQAAMRYFGIDLATHPEALTLDQAALLAGLPRAPSAYDPLVNPKAALERRNQVLENMAKYGYITEQEAKAAEAKPLGVSYHDLASDGWDTHPLFTQFLFDYAQRVGISKEALLQGGLKIYTTVDPQTQNAIEKVFWSGEYDQDFPAPVNGVPVQGAAVFIDPKTGGILGAAGSRRFGFYRDGLDRVFARSQPGSSIKPILEYAPAIESGKFGPDSILNNTPHDFGGGYVPQNDDPNAPGQVTLRYALETSQNVASVWLLQQIGIDTGVRFAENDGIPFTDHDRQTLAIAIGGMEYGVTPLEMAQAYEPFANQGVQMQAHLINRVVNASGDLIYEAPVASKRIMSPQTAATMTQLMEDVVRYGTGRSAQVPGWGVAGKTGTVQWGAGLTSEHRDWVSRAWFDGYTPNMVGSVYIGYDKPHDPVYHLFWDTAPNHYCAMIFADIVRMAEQGRTPETFTYTPSGGLSGEENGTVPSNEAQPAQPPAATNAVDHLTAGWDPATAAVRLSWVSPDAGSVNFSISRVATAGPGAPSSGQATAEPLGTTSELSFEDPDVLAGTTYTYIVQAVDPTTGALLGAPATVSFTVPGAAPPPANADNGTGNETGNGVGNAAENGTGNEFGNGIGNMPGYGAGNEAGNGANNAAGNTAGTVAGAGPGSNGVNTEGNGAGAGNLAGDSAGNGTNASGAAKGPGTGTGPADQTGGWPGNVAGAEGGAGKGNTGGSGSRGGAGAGNRTGGATGSPSAGGAGANADRSGVWNGL
ncbi:MAG: transglycosylase domain-containing protein [Alicyclobacillaceae bacterium]|nr:transglycosylase domain-containing protein [Alicyclobacillaceae bacterium]